MVLTGPMHYAFLKAFCVYGITDLGFRYNNTITLIVNIAKVNIHTIFIIIKFDIFINTIIVYVDRLSAGAKRNTRFEIWLKKEHLDLLVF